MNKQPATSISTLLASLALLLATQTSQAGSATWNLNPTNDDWNIAANWTPNTVPDGPDDTATFGVSSITTVHTGENSFELDSIIFMPGASAYTIIPDYFYGWTMSGAGIINNSGIQQKVYGDFRFANSSSAGTNTVFSINYDANFVFDDQATADHGTFTGWGEVDFNDSSTAANSTFTITGPAGNHTLSFRHNSSAANSTLIATSSGHIYFYDDSEAVKRE